MITDSQAASSVIEAVRQLSRQVEIPQTLHVFEQVKQEDFRLLAEIAMKDTCMKDNLRQPVLEEVIRVYRNAWHG